MTTLSEAVTELRTGVDATIEALSERHRMHRKIKFLLDTRGLLVINRLEGDYVEFGVFRAEMLYAASRVYGDRIRRYIGLDTFEGLPEPQGRDAKIFVFESQGFMASPLDVAKEMLDGVPSLFVQGDFRQPDVQKRFREQAGQIAVLSIDCNWPSSVEAAMAMGAPLLMPGSIVYLDDYFVATREPNFNDPVLAAAADRHGLTFREFMTYPPCARAFIVERRA